MSRGGEDLDGTGFVVWGVVLGMYMLMDWYRC